MTIGGISQYAKPYVYVSEKEEGDEEEVGKEAVSCPPKIRVDEPSQCECLLKEGTISRTDTDVSELKDQASGVDEPAV